MGVLQARLSAVGALDEQSDPESDTVYLWPECVEAWGHWQRLQTQWRTGMAGATGLDYTAVRAYLDESGVDPGSQRRELFACLLACEHACLDVWAAQRAQEPSAPR